MTEKNSIQDIKKYLLVTAIAVIFSVFAQLVIANVQPAPLSAQGGCPSVDSEKGRTVQTVTIASEGTYRVWVRMQGGGGSKNSVYLKIDGNCAINVGDTSVPNSSWKWVDYKDGSTGSKINVNLSAGDHIFRLFGKEQDVKVDRVLALKDGGCTPSGTGDNCLASSSGSSGGGDDSSSGGDESSGSDTSESNQSGGSTNPDVPTVVGDVIITPDGTTEEIDGVDENGAYYIDDETGEKIYAESEISQEEAEGLGYIPAQEVDESVTEPSVNSSLPLIIGLGSLGALIVGGGIFTLAFPAQAKRILETIINFFNNIGGDGSSGPGGIEPEVFHPQD